MTDIVNTTAPETAAAPTAAPAVAPSAAPASAPAQPAATQAAPEAHQPVAPVEGAVMVPHGTVAKMCELADAGDQGAIDAWIKSQPAELQDNLRKAFAGEGVTIQDMDPEAAADTAGDLEFITPDELLDREALAKDPRLADRIAIMHDEMLAMSQELEKARTNLPEPALRDPVMQARLRELAEGKTAYASHFNADAFSAAALAAIESGDMEAVKQHFALVPDVMEAVVRSAVAEAIEENQKAVASEREKSEFNAFLGTGIATLKGMEEFKSNVPEMVNGAPNPENPIAAFTSWFVANVNKGLFTPAVVAEMGGFENLALSWMAKNRGGIGKLVAEAGARSRTSFLQKLEASRRTGMAQASVRPAVGLNSASTGLNIHGVDIERAKADPHGYGAAAISGLDGFKKGEVAKALLAAM